MDRQSLLDDYRDLPGGRGHVIVEGRWAVEALLGSSLDLRSVVVVEGQHEDLPGMIGQRAPVLRCSRAEVEQLVGFPFHRGVVASAQRPRPVRAEGAIDQGLVVACPCNADASNLGAIVRNAAAFGASAVLTQAGQGADIYARKSIRASSGTVFKIPIFESLDLRADIAGLSARGFQVLGTVVGAGAIPITEVPRRRDTVCLLGAEDAGLTDDWKALCDVQTTIPMYGPVQSLNVACSSAVLLYELTRVKTTDC